MPDPIRLFIIYARPDEAFKDELLRHLQPLIRNGKIAVWNDREILAGEKWGEEIQKALTAAELILVLVSSNFFASHYIHEVEIKEALTRQQEGKAHIIPVIVKACAWQLDPLISNLQVLPKDGIAIESWDQPAKAYTGIVHELDSMVNKLRVVKTAESSLPDDHAKVKTGKSYALYASLAALLVFLIFLIPVRNLFYSNDGHFLAENPAPGVKMDTPQLVLNDPANKNLQSVDTPKPQQTLLSTPEAIVPDSQIQIPDLESKSFSNKRFFVLVGEYFLFENAWLAMQRLLQKGYRDVEIVRYREYYGVVVLRTNSRQEANHLKETLDNQIFDVQVIDRQQK